MLDLRHKIYRLLRRSEGFFKADMVYLAKGNFWQFSNQFVTSFLTLGLAIIFANALPKETYGTYRYILSLVGFLNVFTLLGMNSAVARSVASGDEGSFKTSVKYQLGWNLMQMAAFLAMSGYYFFKDNNELGLSMLILSIFTPITIALNTYGAYLDGKKDFKLNNLFSIASTTINVAGMLIAIVLAGEVIWLVIAYSLTTFASTAMFYRWTIQKYNPPASKSPDTIKYGKELTWVGIMGPIVSQIDKILLSHLWGAAELAVYSLALAVPERATTLIKTWVSIGLPKFSNKSPEELDKIFYLRIFQGLVVGLICFIGYFLVAPLLFKYLLPQYLDSIFYSQILAISLLFALPNRYIGLLLISQKSSGFLFISNFIQNILRIAFYIILGIWGGIMGLVITHVGMGFLGMIINITTWKISVAKARNLEEI